MPYGFTILFLFVSSTSSSSSFGFRLSKDKSFILDISFV